MLEHQLYAIWCSTWSDQKLGRKLGKHGYEMFQLFSILRTRSWVDCHSKQSAKCFGQIYVLNTKNQTITKL